MPTYLSFVLKINTNSPFVIINADDYYGQNAFKEAAEFIQTHKNDDSFALVGYKLEDTLSEFGTVSRGVCTLKDNFLKTIIGHFSNGLSFF